MWASIDDLAINRARIQSSRVTPLLVVDLGAAFAIPCRGQICRSMGIEVMTATFKTLVEPLHARHARIRTGEGA